MLEIIDSFNRSACTYEDWYEAPQGEYVLRAELKGLNMLLPDKGLGAEIGAGTGIFAEHLKTRNRPIICVDPAVKMLNKTREKKLQGVLGTAEWPPIKPRRLHFIYMVIVTEFLLEPVKALCSLRVLLKSGSPIILVLINKESPWGCAYSEAGKQGNPIFKHAQFYTLEEAIGLLENAKYEFDTALGILPDPPEIVPHGDPSVIPLARRKKSDAGVFLVRGTKV